MCSNHLPHPALLLPADDANVTLCNLGEFTGYIKFSRPTGYKCQSCDWKSLEMTELFFAPAEGTFLPEVGVTYDWVKRRYI